MGIRGELAECPCGVEGVLGTGPDGLDPGDTQMALSRAVVTSGVVAFDPYVHSTRNNFV